MGLHDEHNFDARKMSIFIVRTSDPIVYMTRRDPPTFRTFTTLIELSESGRSFRRQIFGAIEQSGWSTRDPIADV